MKHLMKCNNCQEYSMKSICGKCDSKTVMPKPPKYSPDDTYGKYRRAVKETALKKEGLI